MYGYQPNNYQGMQNMQQYLQYPYQQNGNQIPQQAGQTPSFQFGGLFRVQSAEDVYRWEIHQGEIIIFITTDGSFMLTKELGFSPMDRPIVKKFRAFEEQQETTNTAPVQLPDLSAYAQKSEIDDLKLELDVLKEQIENMRGMKHEK